MEGQTEKGQGRRMERPAGRHRRNRHGRPAPGRRREHRSARRKGRWHPRRNTNAPTEICQRRIRNRVATAYVSGQNAGHARRNTRANRSTRPSGGTRNLGRSRSARMRGPEKRLVHHRASVEESAVIPPIGDAIPHNPFGRSGRGGAQYVTRRIQG